MTDEDFRPLEHVTKKMTGGVYDIREENTRCDSWEEQDYLNWIRFKHMTLGVKFYGTGADIYESLKLSKDGKERDEYTRILERKTDGDQGKDVGWRVLKRVFGGGKDGQDISPD